MKKQYIIPIFVPHLGCPNDCIFCNQKSISGQKSNMTKEKAKEIIENYLKSIDKENAQIEILGNTSKQTLSQIVDTPNEENTKFYRRMFGIQQQIIRNDMKSVFTQLERMRNL